MRRLLVLASLVVFVDTMFFAAIVPLLPGLSDEFGLSKTEAGMLSGSYAGGHARRGDSRRALGLSVGPRPTTLFGLGVMTVTVLVFAFAESAPILIASRFLQGVAGACSWAGALSWLVAASPRDRRGELHRVGDGRRDRRRPGRPSSRGGGRRAEPRGGLLRGRRDRASALPCSRSGSRRLPRRARRTSRRSDRRCARHPCASASSSSWCRG